MSIDDLVKKFCEGLGGIEPPIPAKLFLDGQLLSTGVTALTNGQPDFFAPTDGSSPDNCPLHGAILKVSGRDDELRLKNFHRCPVGSIHFHFQIEQ